MRAYLHVYVLWHIGQEKYRANKQESTGFSPYQLMYGSPMPLPCDAVEPQEMEVLRPGALYLELKDRLRRLRGQARRNNDVARDRQKRGYDRRVQRVRTFRVNDAVWLHRPIPQGHGKFKRPWVGPYRVVEVLLPTSYRIRLWSRVSGGTQVVHANRLKPCHRPPVRNQHLEEGHHSRVESWLSAHSEPSSSFELNSASETSSCSDSPDSSSTDCSAPSSNHSRSFNSGTTEPMVSPSRSNVERQASPPLPRAYNLRPRRTQRMERQETPES